MRNLYLCILCVVIFQYASGQACVTQIDAGNDRYICPAGGSVTIGSPAIAGATYFWSPRVGLSNTEIAQPTANPSVPTTYTVTVTSGQNLLVNGDFEMGLTFPTDYAIFPGTDGSCPPSTNSFGSIGITNNPLFFHSFWCNSPDHSPAGVNMLCVDGSAFPNRRVWSQTVNVNPNNTYSFSGWVTGLSNTQPAAQLRVTINGVAVLQNFTTTHFFNCSPWTQFAVNWQSGASTTALIEIYDDNQACNGNDFAIDDLSFTGCPVLTDQVFICVCSAPPPPETVTVRVPITYISTLTKWNRDWGHHCFDPPQQLHGHYPYVNFCSNFGGILSGHLLADNNYPATLTPLLMFGMQVLNNNGIYLDLPYNHSLQQYLEIREQDIISASMNLFHRGGIFPSCGPGKGFLNEFNLPQPHNGNNGFMLKRVVVPTIREYCYNNDYSFYNIDNPPQTATNDVVTFPPTSSPTQDYSINITQMIRNSLLNYNGNLSFLIQQSQTATYNNVFFEGHVTFNDIIDVNEPFVEITYIRRGRPTGCQITKGIFAETTPAMPVEKKSRIYPNPVNAQASISSPDKIMRVEVYNAMGGMIKQATGNSSNTFTLDMSNLRPGIYQCKLFTDKGIEHLKFLVQR